MDAPILPRSPRFRRIAFAAAAALCIAPAARAQALPAALDLRVVDGETGAPLAGASVRLDGIPRGTSDANGVLRLSPLGAGRHLLQVGMLGRQPVAPEVSLVPGGALALDVILEPGDVALPPISVVARLRNPNEGIGGGDAGDAGMREREALLAALEVHARAVTELSSPVRDPVVPQVRGRLLADPTGEAGTGDGDDACIPDLFVDGVAVEYRGAVYLGDLAQAEHDPRDGPPEFGAVTSKCGAILIWTTDR